MERRGCNLHERQPYGKIQNIICDKISIEYDEETKFYNNSLLKILFIEYVLANFLIYDYNDNVISIIIIKLDESSYFSCSISPNIL